MKFKNIFFGFFKTLLLTTIFYSSSLYAVGYMFLDLQGYPYTTSNFRPYFFAKDPTTGNLIKVTDTQDSFQFKTYNFGFNADIESYNAEVKPVLVEWSEGTEPFGTESFSSSQLSGSMVTNVEEDLDNLLEKEVHTATYKGRIESVSYAQSPEVTAPKIETIVANPEGLVPGQTTTVKGGGSSLLDRIVRTYKEEGVDKVRLYSAKDDSYYADRGWQVDSEAESEGACGGMETPPLFPDLF